MIIQFPNPKRHRYERDIVIQPTKQQYLSTEDVARMFGFSVRTITAWATEWHDTGGQAGMPAFKMGRSWRFDQAKVQEWLDRKQVPSRQSRPPAATA